MREVFEEPYNQIFRFIFPSKSKINQMVNTFWTMDSSWTRSDCKHDLFFRKELYMMLECDYIHLFRTGITWDLNVEIICIRSNDITSLARIQTCSYLWIPGGRLWRTVWFCNWQFEAVYTGALDPLLTSFIAETWFYLIGYINTQNYLSADNRRTLHEVPLHNIRGVRRVFTHTRIIGPILFSHRII
jgi:hypothetical protein